MKIRIAVTLVVFRIATYMGYQALISRNFTTQPLSQGTTDTTEWRLMSEWWNKIVHIHLITLARAAEERNREAIRVWLKQSI